MVPKKSSKGHSKSPKKKVVKPPIENSLTSSEDSPELPKRKKSIFERLCLICCEVDIRII